MRSADPTYLRAARLTVIQDGERSLIIKHRQCAADGLNYQ